MAPPWYLLPLVALVVLCPDGSKCSDSQNEGAMHALPMITDVFCTEQEGCPEEYSCVKTPLDGYACCPLAQGASCHDGHHCCPSGTHCSEDGHSCLPASNQSAIVCPDGASECPSGSTCCQMADQSWGCCPLEKATCCNDHVHCCPQNTQCDLVHGTCVSTDKVVPMSKKVPARMKLQTSVQVLRTPCRDGSSCPDGSTCCELGEHSFGCCPLISAVCCGDHIHCCPLGTTCDIAHKKCVSPDSETPMVKKIPALRDEETVKCDDTSSCPGSTTCCRLASGEWGCCPFSQAVCCSDKIHCCPTGYTCSGGSCVHGQDSMPWFKKMPALKDQSADVPCDPTTSCPDKTTCCRLPSGDWGCCPIEKAICCSDQSHCCPSGWRCGEQATCSVGPLSFPRLSKTLTSSQIKCDKSHSCPQGTTCCHTEGGGWACCPLEEAVCCSDHLHCCPSGYTCDVTAETCNKPVDELATPATAIAPVTPLDYVWCDSTHVCYDGQTCCVGLGGMWTCCPYPQGVCCPDRVHCCPYGHVCLNSGAQCSRSGSPLWDLGWLKKKQPTL
ncbi:progranulin isoform X1 [Lithobates pipiens]